MLRAVDAGRNCLVDPGIVKVITRDATFAALLAFTHVSWLVTIEMTAPYVSPWTGFVGELHTCAAAAAYLPTHALYN